MSQQTVTSEGSFDATIRSNINNNFNDMYKGLAPVAITASTTLASGTHSNRTVTLSNSAGLTITLPAATGTGANYELVVITTASTGNYVINAAGSDKFLGSAWVGSDDAGAPAKWYDAAGTAVTITMNGTTQGGYAGHTICLQDIATNKWIVNMYGKATGTEATPFS